MKKQITAIGVASVLVAVGLVGLPINTASAATNDTTVVNVTLTGSLSITSNQTAVTISLTPVDTTQTSGTATETITGTSNNGTGFNITAATATTDGSLTVSGTGTDGPIAMTAAGATLSNNSWGAKYASGTGNATAGTVANGSYIPLSSTGVIVADTTNAGDRAFTATYGASANTNISAGTYKTTVTYTIANK